MLGARMHYAVPRILDEAGRLERFFTDFSAKHGWPPLLRVVPKSLRPKSVERMLSRVPAGVPPNRVTAFNIFGCNYARRRARAAAPSTMTQTFLWANRRFGELVCASDWADASAVFTFSSAGLEILQRARRDGLFTVSEQTITPSALEQRLLREECESWPGWEQINEDRTATDFSAREQTEWQLADFILCGSEFVRDGIRQCGGPVEKCVVVPYGVDTPNQKSEVRNRKPGGPLRVLTVGSVGLRKGSPYVLEAARQLKGKAQFRMVGGIGVTREAEAQLREHLELTGPVPRGEIARHFVWADVFLLPSLCEGSATVTYEALAYGLPVICTANTGSVARDGVEGLIIPIRDATAVVESLRRFLGESEFLKQMSANATAKAKEFTVAKYGDRLRNALPMSRPDSI